MCSLRPISMKLRIRINGNTSRVDLEGEEPSLKELIDHIKETLLSTQGLSPDTEFGLSLNGSERLSDTGQTLSSCSIVSGDLICVLLPESAVTAAAAGPEHRGEQRNINAAMTPEQPSSSSGSPVSPPQSYSEAAAPSWEPMLCSEAEEGQAPLSLELLYHAAQTSSPSDAVMVAGNLLMLETGFVPQGSELKPAEMPAGWRSTGGVYRLQYTHPLCENSLAMVVAVCMGPVLVINATLKLNQSVDAVRKLCLNPSSYVTNEWPGESAAAAFKDLRKLSRVFKDQMAYPLIAAAREAMALPVAFGLAALPPELLLRVLRLLDIVSVVRLSAVCRHFNASTADSSLWRHLYRRDFTDPDPSRSMDTDWKELYKRFYKLRCENRHVVRHRSLPHFHRNPWDIFGSLPVPLHPPLPGIIGGDYDQRPNLPRGLLPRPRYDPIGPPRVVDGRPLNDLRRARPMGGRPADVRRGFI
ncbi:F-box only protein 7 [Echeneis naucrates]|uniref:F-box domain-containing protein n=1 Tax=Echeneis naucrates TaxID=173247 RepID=A0A665VEQ9_ECHNA|nr:F-box only protein 7 [Echeneis naucrates]